jgi:hypothetical protein
MRNIHKNPEPTSLTQHRCNTNTDYDNYAEKDDLRESLVNEQRGICCYCMQRIQPESDVLAMQARIKELENLLAVANNSSNPL